uniref:Homeobox domain-containing protein n=1 Tax=Otolemur garnettii TaxID=30611 RepID=H0XI24_OTOGA
SLPPSGVPLPSDTPRRQRRERTCYTKEQQRELEKYFEMKKYPNHQDRQTLAKRLNLQECQVQVWFKNRRAKQSREQICQEPPGYRGHGGAWDVSIFPRAHAPGTSRPKFPHGPGFPGSLLSAPPGIFPAAEATTDFSLQQAQEHPGYSAQEGIPAAPDPMPGPSSGPTSGPNTTSDPGLFSGAAPAPAPAPGPLWSQSPYACDFSADIPTLSDISELLSSQDPSQVSPVSITISGHQERDDFVDKKDSGSKSLLDL